MIIFKLDIESGDDDANDDPGGVVIAALETVIQKVRRSKTEGTLHDKNGNRIGSWTFDDGAQPMKLTEEMKAKAQKAFQHANDWSRGDLYLALEKALEHLFEDLDQTNDNMNLLVEIDMERQTAELTLEQVRAAYDHDPWQPIGTLGKIIGKHK